MIKYIDPNTPSKVSSESPMKLRAIKNLTNFNSISSWKKCKQHTKSSVNITMELDGAQIIEEIRQVDVMRVASKASKRSDIKVQKINNFVFPTARDQKKNA